MSKYFAILLYLFLQWQITKQEHLETFLQKTHQSQTMRRNPMRQSNNLIHSLIFAFFNRNSMRLRLFGFPDESPHAIPSPDDFCITRMMRPGLMELSVSGGISLHSPKLVDKTRLRPLTQSTVKLLTQQSWEKQRERERESECYKRKKHVGESQSEQK